MLLKEKMNKKNLKRKKNDKQSGESIAPLKKIAANVDNENSFAKQFKKSKKKNIRKIQTSHKLSENKKIDFSNNLIKHNKNKINKAEVHKEKKENISSFDNENYLKNIPNFDHIPSDSEEELDESKSKNNELNSSNNNLEKKFYTDFTENTIFVGNIPLTYDKKKIVKVFSQFGKVVCARIRCVPIANINVRKRVAAIKKEFNSHRNSMVAYVKFKSGDSVKAAIEANGMVLDGHHLRIDFAKSTEKKDFNKAVFVGGLPFDIEDDELWEFFENCGKIKSVRIIRDSHTSMGKGIGYVNFDSTASVELALQMDGQELKKKVINVKRCFDTSKKNNLRTFGKNKTKEVVKELLSKRNQQKLKLKNKKSNNKQLNNDFLGTKATVKKKKKKKPSKDALRRKQVMKLLNKP